MKYQKLKFQVIDRFYLLSLFVALIIMSVTILPLIASESNRLLSLSGSNMSEPTYRIYPLRNGVCKIAGNHAFHGGNNDETYDFALYIWLILGGDEPMLVDAGISDLVEMNRGAAHVLREPITQDKNESSRAQLR
jgi:hypothetical protein